MATGETFRSLGYHFRVGSSTVGKIVSEVCTAIWDRMNSIYMRFPQTPEEWEKKAEGFSELWNFPHCIGAIDGKHVVMKAPANSGSRYYNYKGTFSTVLLALVDANLQFIAIDVGSFGRNSDGGIFAHSNLGKALSAGTLNLPKETPLPGAQHLGPMPYVIVGDEAFPLQKNVMRPFPGRKCTEKQRTFNYRLCRARRTSENGFGVLGSYFRVYETRLLLDPNLVIKIVKATCLLHNLLRLDSTPAQTTAIIQEMDSAPTEALSDLPALGNRASNQALQIRENFMEYFTAVKPLPWQESVVNRGKHNLKK